MNPNPRPKIKILDGGFSTQLSCHVREQIDGDPLWCARFLETHPEACLKSHLDFLRSGADIIMTNTYQASVDGFMKYLKKNEQESRDLIKRAVELAQTAVSQFKSEYPDSQDKEILIAGSVGPYGACLHNASEFSGSYIDEVDITVIKNWHRTRMEILVNAGVDILAIETIPALAEAQVLLELLQEFPKAKAWLCFVCKDEQHTCYGDDFEKTVRYCWGMAKDQLVAIGVNCLAPKFVEPLLSRINSPEIVEDSSLSSDNGHEVNTRIPLIVYPNSGESYNPQLGWIDQDKRERLDKYIGKWLDLGVIIVGGCCRNYASDVNRIFTEVRKWEYHHG